MKYYRGVVTGEVVPNEPIEVDEGTSGPRGFFFLHRSVVLAPVVVVTVGITAVVKIVTSSSTAYTYFNVE